MRKYFNIAGLTQVKQRGISPFSSARIYFDKAARWAMSSWGNRVAARNTQLAMPGWTKRTR